MSKIETASLDFLGFKLLILRKFLVSIRRLFARIECTTSVAKAVYTEAEREVDDGCSGDEEWFVVFHVEALVNASLKLPNKTYVVPS